MTEAGWLELPPQTPYGLANLPYGVFSTHSRPSWRRVGVAIGEQVLDVAALADRLAPGLVDLLARPSLNALLAAGPGRWRELRARLRDWLTDAGARAAVTPSLIDATSVELHLPFEVADYVDFYSSAHHAENVGRIFRPDQPPLLPNWRHVPIAYHGRAGTVVVSGTPIRRPYGQRKPPGQELPGFGPSLRLDIEAEVGFVVGPGTEPGRRVSPDEFEDFVFGVCLVNDWSARDIQSWEYVPLGPFQGKSFATSVSPWIVPLPALDAARVGAPPQDPPVLAHLVESRRSTFDITLAVQLNGHRVSEPPFAGLYWTPAQQLAHLTANGARLRTGDLYASGTVSGAERNQRGSLLELAWNGREPIELPDGTTRSFLLDGDRVSISATAPGPGGSVIGFGSVEGEILPA
ncbi:MAG TPA: fumarylacetoacetase [Micromonosporaceae bacterium]|jgi:fumarylacetoacetase